MTDPVSDLPVHTFIMRDGSSHQLPVAGNADGPEIFVGRRWANGESFGQQIRFVRVRDGVYREAPSQFERTSID